MKGLFLVLVSAFALHANATSYLSCENGPFEKMGDGYFQVNLLEDGIEFFPYEASFSFDFTDIKNDNNVYSIVNKKTVISAEGEESESVINAMLILDGKSENLNVAISYDGEPFTAFELTCKTKNTEE